MPGHERAEAQVVVNIFVAVNVVNLASLSDPSRRGDKAVVPVIADAQRYDAPSARLWLTDFGVRFSYVAITGTTELIPSS